MTGCGKKIDGKEPGVTCGSFTGTHFLLCAACPSLLRDVSAEGFGVPREAPAPGQPLDGVAFFDVRPDPMPPVSPEAKRFAERILTADHRLSVLRKHRLTYIEYARHRIDDEDWHGVSDAANDLRELDVEIRMLETQAT